MNSFLKSIRSGLGGRDAILKDSLISKLSACVKDLQVEEADPDSKSSTEAVSGLCTVLEAIFIHGLKDSFLRRVSQAVLSEIDARPDPDFWGPLLVVSHRDVIDQVMKLHLVQTDVGRCRAWLRLALNEGILSSYLKAIRKEGQRALSHYYIKGALLRDGELLDLAQCLIEGVESFSFNLPLNSSLLDTWTVQPLLLAGLWTPPMRASASKDAVAVATDAAQILEKEDADSLSIDTISIASLASHHNAAINPVLKLNEEEALKIILGTPVNEAPISTYQGGKQILIDESKNLTEPTRSVLQEPEVQDVIPKCATESDKSSGVVEQEEDNVSALGNSLIGRLGWSSSFQESLSDSGVDRDLDKESEEEKRKKKQSKSRGSSAMLQSYHSLLESYNTASVPGVQLPDLEDFLQQFNPSSSDYPTASIREHVDDLSYPEELGFEIIENSSCLIPDFAKLIVQVTKLPRELGLDTQVYKCYGCDQPIGFNFGAARLCGFSGHYFCNDCIVAPGEEWVIPARILYNWDFRRFSVSKQSAIFLNETQHHPILDVKVLNPVLYLIVEEMAELEKLRNQLNLLRAYLFTCREPVIDELRKKVWPREYLYEHVHLYSLFDLMSIPMGTLAQLLKQVVSFAQKHVYGCWLCSQKGFFCEVCQNPNVIYPFDTDTTYRCLGCNAVFHATCLNSDMPCPKCKRRRQREVVSSDDVTVES